MPQPDQHDQSADALQAIAAGEEKPSTGSGDGFVGPEPPEEGEEGATPSDEEPIVAALAPGAPLAIPAELTSAPSDRRRHVEEFNRRERQARAHQYKTVMIPLLITLGVILILMGLYAVIRVVSDGGGGPAPEAAPAGDPSAVLKWFPLLAFPMGAILLTGAWIFHRDVKGKRP